ncbi:MAG: coproporphyrinogen III oxidase, partial [Boseongicola sp. SB0670_bin_30]|nr:coproporphyrinogen III oxidase [Boseongicola sp. SB0670_bin_30]
MTECLEERKARASSWFGCLRDEIVAAFEGVEDTHVNGPN